MSIRDMIVLALVGSVLLFVSIMSIMNTGSMHKRAQDENAPYLTALYSSKSPEQQAVVSSVVSCMVQYGKVDPGHTPVDQFDHRPLSQIPAADRPAAIASLRTRLEGMCVAYGVRASQSSRKHGPAAHLSAQQYAKAASALGMDMASAQSWLDKLPPPR